MSRSIVITVSQRGETTIEAQGFRGTDCREATKSLKTALGRQERETLTSEFYAEAPTTQQLPQQNR